MRLIKLKSTLAYKPGDVVMARPQNCTEAVEELLELLRNHKVRQLKPESVLSVKARDDDMPVPPALSSPLSLQQCALHYWDLNVSSGTVNSGMKPSVLILGIVFYLGGFITLLYFYAFESK